MHHAPAAAKDASSAAPRRADARPAVGPEAAGPPSPVPLSARTAPRAPEAAEPAGRRRVEDGPLDRLAAAGRGSASPHLDRVQASFGRHDIAQVQASVGQVAAAAAQVLGAQSYATGSPLQLPLSGPDLHTVAHEAAHLVQQQAGVQL